MKLRAVVVQVVEFPLAQLGGDEFPRTLAQGAIRAEVEVERFMRLAGFAAEDWQERLALERIDAAVGNLFGVGCIGQLDEGGHQVDQMRGLISDVAGFGFQSIGPGNSNTGCFSNFGLAQGGVKAIELRETLRGRASSLSNNNSPQPSAQTGVLSTLMSTTPVSNELNELTMEVSAIREYATSQQDRVRQLQDGYDWSIIKRFCIRIIRCIDNLDERIAQIAEAGEDTQSLEDVRDELVFSLESSGVEQFEPEINACYKGLEKTVEAVKTREPTDDPDLVGKIAKVIKPGYEYVVSDEEVRVVRCSQVKLYGPNAQTCEEQQEEQQNE